MMADLNDAFQMLIGLHAGKRSGLCRPVGSDTFTYPVFDRKVIHVKRSKHAA